MWILKEIDMHSFSNYHDRTLALSGPRPEQQLPLIHPLHPLLVSLEAPPEGLRLHQHVAAYDKEAEVRHDRVAEQHAHRARREALVGRVDRDRDAKPQHVDKLEEHRRRKAAQAADDAVNRVGAD